MRIRLATTEDIDSLVALLESLFELEEDFAADPERQADGLKMMIDALNAAVFAAELDGRVVGMVTGQLMVSTAEGGAALLLEDLIVQENMRERGIGKALLHAVGDWGSERGADRMQLLSDRNNQAALSFYEQNGWRGTNLIVLRRYRP